MLIIPLSKWTGKSRRVPRNRNTLKRGTYDPVTKSDQYVVLFPNDTMISVYDEKSFRAAEEYEAKYQVIQKEAMERKISGEAYIYCIKKPAVDKRGKEDYIVKSFSKKRRKL